MNRRSLVNTLLGLFFGLLLWAPPVHAIQCNLNIRATTPTEDFALDDVYGTATHLKTGLTWMRCPLGWLWNSINKACVGGHAYSWGEALRAARGYSFAGHSDWRLPNIKELRSIVEERCTPSINQAVFPITDSWANNDYWSSTSSNNLTDAWTVYFTYADAKFIPKRLNNRFVLLVRGGQWFGDYGGGGGGGGASVMLDVLDGRDYWGNGQFTTNTEVLADPFLGQPMDGAAADGEARLLLRARTTQPTSVTFSIPVGDGQLIHYQGTPSGSSVTVPTVPVGNEHMAFAIYRAPEQFPRAGHPEDESIARRDIPLKISRPDGITVITRMLVLERPPVVLVHGWNSNKKECWDEFDELLRASGRIPGISITKADYAKTSRDAFSVNASVPRESVDKARREFRQRHIAVAQADVIGHSMGGILSRIWAGNSEYRRWANFGAGDFNKLITMDSPHRGSPIADALYTVNYLADTQMRCGSMYGHVCIPQSPPANALRDLSTDSTALAAMRSKEAKAPSHTIVGDYRIALEVDLLDFADPWINFIGKTLFDGSLSTKVEFYIPTNSDLVVPVDSQKGDLLGTCSESTPAQCSEYNQIHTEVHDAPEVADRVVELLNAPATDGDLFNQNGFPWSSGGYASLAFRQTAAADAATIVEGGIQIVAPPAGTVVQPGQAVTVSVQPDTGVTLEAASLVTYQTWLHLDQAPFQFSLTVPTGAAGTLGLLVSAKDTAGVIHLAHTHLQVVPPVALSRLDVTPATVTFEQAGVQAGLQVEGVYADSSVRDLTVEGTGTTYQSSNPGVVTVDADGRLTAQGNGTATVTATNGGVSAYTTVRVEAGTDLAISQTDSPDPIGADGLVTYTLTVQNLGTQRALAVQVSNTLPAGATLAQATGTGWVCNESGGVVSCVRDALDTGVTATISLKVEVPLPCGVIANQATVEASTHDGYVDNNVSIATTSCSVQTYTLTVAKAGTGSGTVTSDPAGIDCGATCTASFDSGTPITLTAARAANSTFAGWSPDSCDSALTLTADTTCTATFNRTNRPPIANAGPDRTVESTGPNGASVMLDGSNSSDPDGDSLTFSWTGPFGTASGPNPTITLPLGDHTITLTVADGHGGTASDTVVVQVHDTTPPVLTLPADINTDATSASGAVVTYTASATDTVSGAINPTCTPASGSTFPIGVTTVGCTATDQAGNTASGSFTITVVATNPAGSTPFSAFSINPLRINQRLKTFFLLSTFTLGPGSNGIDPTKEPVTLTIAGFTTTIPAGSFRKGLAGVYAFAGKINNVTIEALIPPLGNKRFGFQVGAYNVNLSGTQNPVAVGLTIGDDSGTAKVNAVIIK